MSLSKSRIALLLVVVLALAVFAIRALSSGGPRDGSSRTAAAQTTGTSLADGSAAKFRFLAGQTSNRCDLQPGALAAMPDHKRLQGACCSAMDPAAYRSQVRGLAGYRRLADIPRDPYDVPVSLAKRLLAYDRTVELTSGQSRTYRRAMRMSDTKGPCCCRCWRWYAFRGLSKHMIADRRWPPAKLARVIDLVEGCGGPAEDA